METIRIILFLLIFYKVNEVLDQPLDGWYRMRDRIGRRLERRGGHMAARPDRKGGRTDSRRWAAALAVAGFGHLVAGQETRPL